MGQILGGQLTCLICYCSSQQLGFLELLPSHVFLGFTHDFQLEVVSIIRYNHATQGGCPPPTAGVGTYDTLFVGPTMMDTFPCVSREGDKHG